MISSEVQRSSSLAAKEEPLLEICQRADKSVPGGILRRPFFVRYTLSLTRKKHLLNAISK